MATRTAIVSIFVVLVLGVVVTLAGSEGSVERFGLPVFAWVSMVIFFIQWAVFLFAWATHSERFFDLTGSFTYLVAVLLCIVMTGSPAPHSFLVAAMVAVWALRLGTFLTARVRAAGSDSRFDAMKNRFAWFLFTWTTQGLWVLVAAGATLAAISRPERTPVGTLAIVGSCIWAIGFGAEVIADEQKRRFRSVPQNRNSFITTGLWSWSRHPNYAGEILLWFGIAVASLPALEGWGLLTLVSPVFVWALLTRVSGIPILETAADRRWGDRVDYQSYKARTPALFPRFSGIRQSK
tara:strand:+ start:908 stop:1789 length:882 start_codon:yes stop_codon:yes gene_type:complete